MPLFFFVFVQAKLQKALADKEAESKSITAGLESELVHEFGSTHYFR